MATPSLLTLAIFALTALSCLMILYTVIIHVNETSREASSKKLSSVHFRTLKLKFPVNPSAPIPTVSQPKRQSNTTIEKLRSQPLREAQKFESVVKKPETNIRPKLHAVTYASHGGKDDRFCRAVESALRNNIDLVILGWGVPWKGLSQKLEAAQKYAASLPPNDVILFTDAFDVLFSGDADSIVDRFIASEAKLLFSAECGCWPHVMEDRQACFTGYPPSPTPYRYLNSGTWIGFAQSAAEMLASVQREAGKNFANANDQKLVADYFIAGRFGIKLDYYNKIFQSMHMTLDPPLPRCNPVEDVEVDPIAGLFRNRRTGSSPSVLHFNGGGKPHHLKMESKMWYKLPQHRTREKMSELGQKQVRMPNQPGGFLRFDQFCANYIHSTK